MQIDNMIGQPYDSAAARVTCGNVRSANDAGASKPNAVQQQRGCYVPGTHDGYESARSSSDHAHEFLCFAQGLEASDPSGLKRDIGAIVKHYDRHLSALDQKQAAEFERVIRYYGAFYKTPWYSAIFER